MKYWRTLILRSREVIKNLAVIPLFGAAFFGMAKKRGWISFEEKNLAAKTDAYIKRIL